MKQLIRKTMMIVCEGTVTEPKYLSDLLAEVQQKSPEYKIDILPIPPKEELEEEEQSYVRKSGRRRVLLEVEEEPELPVVPQEYRTQPLEYVWKAREALKVYGEAWAVFDRDEHPALDEALTLADKDVDLKMVNIAFSSRSFEMWLLLHFEASDFPFPKTLCRTRTYKGKKRKKHDEYHLCGEDKGHPLDCKGALCITGYMKENGYLDKDEDVKNITFKDVFKDNVHIAIGNALGLRKKVGSRETTSVDKLDPYTDFDRLVFKLLNIEFDYQWFGTHQIIIDKIEFDLVDRGDNLILKIKNSSKGTYLVNPDNFLLLDIYNRPMKSNEGVRALDPGKDDKVTFNMEDLGGFIPAFLRIPLDHTTWGIFEL